MKPVVAPFGSGGILLRPIRTDDLPLTLAWRNRDEARIWFRNAAPISEEGHRQWFAAYLGKPDDLHFIVEANGVPVGQAAVYHIDGTTRSAEIGRFLIAPEASGKGIMRMAVAHLLDLCRDELGLERLYLDVFETNRKSIALCRQCGFEETGRHGALLTMARQL